MAASKDAGNTQGDVNSTVAAALVAAKLQIPLAHVEAGMRSNGRTMPEEINRLVTDRLSDVLFVTERSAVDDLVGERIAPRRVTFVGIVMIDTSHAWLERAAPARATLSELGAAAGLAAVALEKGFAFVTLHRPIERRPSWQTRVAAGGAGRDRAKDSPGIPAASTHASDDRERRTRLALMRLLNHRRTAAQLSADDRSDARGDVRHHRQRRACKRRRPPWGRPV